MKKKIIALTLTTVLALSSTSAFASEVNCTNTNYRFNYNNLFRNYISRNANTRNKYRITVNGKESKLNIDWKAALQEPTVPQNTIEKPVTPVEKPAAPVEETTVTEQATTPAPAENNTNVSSSNLTYEEKVVELVNVERQKAGLSTLTMDSAISNVARAKSKDMADNKYFAHQSPTYGSAGDMLEQFGIKWSAWGENIAYGQRTPEIVVNAWMNSPGHRANILSTNFSKIGIGYVTNSNGTPYWTQIFTN